MKTRPQKVVIGDECSEIIYVGIGVFQGSSLRPFLFLAFINDLPVFCLIPEIEIIHARIGGVSLQILLCLIGNIDISVFLHF